MAIKEITRETSLGEIIETPAGHDIIMKALYQVGISGEILKKGPLSKLSLGKLQNNIACG